MFKKILIILKLFLSLIAVYAEENATDTLNQSIDDAELTAPEETKTFDDSKSASIKPVQIPQYFWKEHTKVQVVKLKSARTLPLKE